MNREYDAQTIPGVICQAAREFGNMAAIEDEAGALSFAGLHREMDRAGAAFIKAGLEAGDRVAIWGPNSRDWIIAALGVMAAGGIIVPLNTRLKGGEAADILDRSGARLLVTVSGFLGVDYPGLIREQDLPALREVLLLEGESPGAMPWDRFLKAGERVAASAVAERREALSGEAISDIIFTSGTTGAPKGVMATHGQSVRMFKTWCRHVGLRQGDRYLIINPFFHTFGYKAGWLACFLRGATALPQAVFDVGQVLRRISGEKISVLPGPPTLYQSLLADPERGKADLSSLRLAVTGAASIPVELIERMRGALGIDTVLTAYGLTEACGVVTMCSPDDSPETIARTCGRAVEGVEMRCVDDEGRDAPAGEPGEILVRGYNVMAGYFNDPAGTAQAIDKDGWLKTGDIGIVDERGYLRITDRKKDMFIVGGFNCYPAEIENIILRNRRIAQVAVIGVADERMGEVAHAFVVPAGNAALTGDEVIAWCRNNMANYKVPRKVCVVDELPLNPSGKVQKFVLKEMAGQ